MVVIEEALPDELSLSYNGGKDCLVLLILILACLPAATSHIPPKQSAHPSENGSPPSIQPLKAIYIAPPDPFPEVEDFVSISTAQYHLDLTRYALPMRQALEAYQRDQPPVRAIFMGTRRTDPHSEFLTPFSPTDGDWPQFMRVNPVLDWHYTEIWTVSGLSSDAWTYHSAAYTTKDSRHWAAPRTRARTRRWRSTATQSPSEGVGRYACDLGGSGRIACYEREPSSSDYTATRFGYGHSRPGLDDMMALAFKTYMISEYGCGVDGRAWRSSGRRLLPHAPGVAGPAASGTPPAFASRGPRQQPRLVIGPPQLGGATSIHPTSVPLVNRLYSFHQTPVHPTLRCKGEPIGPPRPGSLSFIHASIDDSPVLPRAHHTQQLRLPDDATTPMTDSSFLQAQQRVAARRQAREAQAAARLAAQRESSRAAQQLQRLPFPFNRLADAVGAASSREGTRPAFRVAQVDAELLDEELVDLLRGQVGDALRYFAGGHLHDDWSAEIMLALRAVLFKLTVWDHDATYGAALQNLKYTDARRAGPVLVPPSRAQKSLYGLVTVFGKYAWTRWEDWLLEQDDGHSQPSARVRLLSRWTSRLSTVHSAAAFASFLVFLLRGRYRTLLDRILRMRLAAPTSQVSREVSFEYLNRQLVWHAFTEFLLFVLPLIGINRWRRWLSRTWRKTKEIIHTGPTSGDGSDAAARGEYAFLPERTCAICYQDQNDAATTETEVLAAAASSGGVIGSAQTDVTNPYETIPCGCVYCFVCLATRLEREEGEGWTCLRCGEHVKECRPWSGDVLEPAAGPTARRKVSGGAAKVVAFSDDVTGGLTEQDEDEDEDEEDEDEEGLDVLQESSETDGEDEEGKWGRRMAWLRQ
ncbi:peroxisomal biogenesis factor 2 [Purpureocillium lilacinum]|uniref:Peroxisomal biogenesis factor 2 n=1 Tax=Purpureocillium lilacinum TaxID=33203 RepID=A0A179GQD0_PURLI|nr:peroxisomal biogenesis factor 2 [Purpureocillium lilacinum]OAQ79349.1 peroxisomal biogenesis factor 2 [Purpureocillium lilacinum]